ncbi:hypothetical protein N656DRAFT_398422 [Canariomyces notabilis]|uniref:Uncharacterized protein n=1 Tax=Canariomyces notabilis TaxID=2074819 RepID=A0AAN6TK26_9PEZI|nr:hypothetical protein N656DRAFT_398422 [Canariomyces arenarius]
MRLQQQPLTFAQRTSMGARDRSKSWCHWRPCIFYTDIPRSGLTSRLRRAPDRRPRPRTKSVDDNPPRSGILHLITSPALLLAPCRQPEMDHSDDASKLRFSLPFGSGITSLTSSSSFTLQLRVVFLVVAVDWLQNASSLRFVPLGTDIPTA